MPDILLEVADHVATVTMNRPERRNAFTVEMFDLLGDTLQVAARDPRVRCIVLTGSGDAFSSGLDLAEAAGQVDRLDRIAFEFDADRSPAIVLQRIEVPVVAAINGPAAGYAVGMAINADIRVMSASARLVPATKRNLLPESGDTWLLPRLVGWEQAARFYFLGQDMGADEALAAGVVSEVAPDPAATKERAAALASQVAAMPPQAVRAAKRLMRAGRGEGYEEHVHRALLQLLPMFRTKDFAEAVAAFFEKRDPEFIGE
ncbi:MAG: enoyl-CoA hydratase/isomerase family protein [Acidimicrobiia bacterium]|nr:MAG: enoyl-CoA hydratase/isomerase family protein [Acidimicrobiia bacterium]